MAPGKLKSTNEVVEEMRVQLGELEPVLKEKAAATAELLLQVQKDQEQADAVKKVVSEEEAVVKSQANETQALADDAKRDLDEALPALDAAVTALNSLNKKDIVEIKSFTTPPELVRTTMEAVCILLSVKPDWDSAKKLLGETDFMSRLFNYDKDKIAAKTIKQLKAYIDNPQFTPAIVTNTSIAAKSMCMWVIAINTYYHVSKDVAPKRERLEVAQAQLDEAMSALKDKQDKLQAVVDQVNSLKMQLRQVEQEQRDLQDQAQLTQVRLARAGKLTSSLADEAVRWQLSDVTY